jgi:hypothetical protein
MAKFFPTIAYQLAISIPTLKPLIQSALCDDPSIPTKAARYQFESLIVKPFQSLEGYDSSCKVIVIDAIDECSDKKSAEAIIHLLADVVMRLRLPLQFFITSRPEGHIEKAFKGIHDITHIFRLHDFDAQEDIRLFLESRFQEIYEDHGDVMRIVPKPWPSVDNIIHVLRALPCGFVCTQVH